jgi:quercetin dioxygenase-like cupin family protein
MGFSIAWRNLALSLLVGFCFVSGGPAQSKPQNIEAAEDLRHTRIYTDADGVSHFGETTIEFTLADYAPPAPPISVSEALRVTSVVLISSPPGWHGDWHPAPQRQIMFCLEGNLEVRVSDGQVRTFGPGSVLLVEDTEGQGHISHVVGTDRVFMAALPLESNSE